VDADVLFAGMPVSDFKLATSWYESFFARPPDVIAHETEVMWSVTDRGWIYVVHDIDHAGNSIACIAVPDLDQTISGLARRGVSTGPIQREGEAGRKSVVLDPDGNSIAIIEVSGSK
jgi:predicted enzyme related to lactoylglutathione lyase